MSLKWKLLLIIISIAIIPPLTIAVQIGTQVSAKLDATRAFYKVMDLVSKHLNTSASSGDFSVFKQVPAVVELAIHNAAGKTVLDLQGSEAARIENWAEYRFNYPSEKETYNVRIRIPASTFLDLDRPIIALPLTLLFLLVFVSVLSILIVRSLGTSISRLEEATKKIAAGDLDFSSDALAKGDLASVGISFNHMKIQLKEDRERRDRFIMGVSHDLKTPLAVIQGYLEAMDDGFADTEEKRAHFLSIMRSKANLLSIRIGQLIQLAKTSTHEWQQNLEESDFTLFIGKTLESLAEYCSIRSFSLEQQIEIPKPCLLRFDRDMIARVFENLLENAITYGDSKTPIRVLAKEIEAHIKEKEGRHHAIHIRVENGGAGISNDNLDKIFEPFFRGDKSRKDGGFGLGLASVKSIIESHGWAIHAESEPGLWTAFIIEIPLRVQTQS
ncbi:hypothetical protein MASR2M78_06920 [Treponema sp.]